MDKELAEIACVFYTDLYTWGNSVRIILVLFVLFLISHFYLVWRKRQSLDVRDGVLFDLSKRAAEQHQRNAEAIESMRTHNNLREKEVNEILAQLRQEIADLAIKNTDHEQNNS